MRYIKFVYKIFVFLVLFIAFILISLYIDIYFKNQKEKRKRLIKNASYFSKLVLKLFNIKVSQRGMYVNDGQNHIIVSNHLSYFDIIVLSAFVEAVFISTKEVEKTFLFGHIAKYGGAIFIDRKNKSNILSDMELFRDVLEEGFNVVVFLEGTTSNGDDILPFKSSFVEVILKAQKPILPICIKYKSINGKPIAISNRDYVFYYGDMTLLNHVFSFLLNVNSMEIELFFLNPLYQTSHFSRKELTKLLYEDIRSCYLEKTTSF
ncbi:lysophospholipid acyltransferase family protein [Hydrogenobaculum acidophilum]